MLKQFIFIITISVSLETIRCHGSISPLIEKINRMDDDILQQEISLQKLKESVYSEFDSMELSLRSELLNSMVPEYIEERVKEYIHQTLRVKSLEKLLNSDLMSEVSRMRQDLQLLKGKYHRMNRKLIMLEGQNLVMRNSLAKRTELVKVFGKSGSVAKNVDNSEFKPESSKGNFENKTCPCEYILTRVEAVEKETGKHKEQLEVLETTVYSLSESVREMNTSVYRHTALRNDSDGLSVSSRDCLLSSRILLVPFQSPEKSYQLLLIQKNIKKDYVTINITSINAIAYDSGRKELFIASFNPLGIFQSYLDTPEVTLLREGVRTYGMDVDGERNFVFMTMHTPRYSICRMQTNGNFFKPIVDLSSYGSTPWAITVDVRNKKIYATSTNKLFSISYEGTNIKFIDSGNSMYSLALDYSNDFMYYNNGNTVMRRPLNGSMSAHVTRLSYTPRSFVFYSNTLYITGGKRLDALYFFMSNIVPLQLFSLDKTYLASLI